MAYHSSSCLTGWKFEELLVVRRCVTRDYLDRSELPYFEILNIFYLSENRKDRITKLLIYRAYFHMVLNY